MSRILASMTRRWAAAAFAAALIVTGTAPASAAGTQPAPSQQSLERLRHYEAYIQHYASLSYGSERHRVSANFLRALVLGESAAKERALSHKGARGLAQIMPQTGRIAVAGLLALGTDFLYVDRERLRRFTPADLYDPAVNLLIASYLTAKYHAAYGGSSSLVTAAWNAGPQAVARYGNRTPPYAETRGLVRRVNGYLRYLNSAAFASSNSNRWDTGGWHAPGWDLPFDSTF